MIDRRHPDTVLLDPLTVLAGNAVVRVDEPLGCDPAEADDDLRRYQCYLVAQVTDAGVLLRFQRVPVSRWVGI